jgi:serine/threonine-protein phosphatase 2B catalytic subunit
MESFDSLPIACIVNDKFLAVHGGLSPELKKIEDL